MKSESWGTSADALGSTGRPARANGTWPTLFDIARRSWVFLALLGTLLPSAVWARSVFVGHTCLAYSSPSADLAALGFFDTFVDFDVSAGTPTLAALQATDVALIYTNCPPADPTGLGDVLADYVDAGGKVVVATYGLSTGWAVAGRISGPGYLPLINFGLNSDVSGVFSAAAPSDVIFSFPSLITPASISYFHNSNFSDPILDGGAVLLAHDGFGKPLAAINAVGTVMGLNLFPEGGGYGGNNSELYRFLENSLARVGFVCNQDGVIDLGEECDDGNGASGDGCDLFCRVEPCYACSGAPSTCSILPDGSNCADGLFCNGSDTCSAGACSIHSGDPCSGGSECNNVCNENFDTCAVAAGSPCMDDGNECTEDQCNGLGACTHPDEYFTYCDDGLFCTGNDYCYGGSCSYHEGDPCVYDECNDVCDETNDACTPTADGIPCSGDGNVCTGDACDGTGICAHPPLPAGTACPADQNECTADACDGAGGCAHPPVLNGTSCDDDDACTQTDQCQGGNCVGANPVICAAPLCRAAGNCDPFSGACSSCPVGYAPGNGGCQKTYRIDASLLDNQASYCDGQGSNRHNGCSATPFGFHWTDPGDTSVGDVIGVDIQVEAGIDCSGVDHTVLLNATTVGEYAGEYQCYCLPAPTPRVLANVATSAYAKGSTNAVSITSVDCDGLSQAADGYYALVTVTYENLGSPIAIRNGCRQAQKSKLKYRNGATEDADKLKWRWGKGAATTQIELDDPTDSADYELCVFGETSGDPTLLFSSNVSASSTLWKSLSSGYKYKDKTAAASGVSKILLKSGVNEKSKIIVNGKGAGLSDPSLPLSPSTDALRAQITNTESGVCWESGFPISNVTVDSGGIKAKVP